MEKDTAFLGEEKIGKLIFKLSLPAITAQLVNMFYNLVDRIYIGHIPEVGPLALTGVGVCMPIIMIITAFAAFVSMGSAPRASIYMGKGDNKTAEKNTWQFVCPAFDHKRYFDFCCLHLAKGSLNAFRCERKYDWIFN